MALNNASSNDGKNGLQLSSPEDHPFLLPTWHNPTLSPILFVQILVFIVMWKEQKS